MTTMKTKASYDAAKTEAEYIIKFLQPHCERIEIAGSIRRKKQEVGDIELVAIPKPKFDMFGERIADDHDLNYFGWETIGRPVKNGNKFKQIALYSGLSLDLFIVVAPAQWGVIFTIRTGSADFSHRLVTSKKFGGLMPSNLTVKDGAIWHNGHIIETPEEKDVFDLISVAYIEPELRVK